MLPSEASQQEAPIHVLLAFRQQSLAPACEQRLRTEAREALRISIADIDLVLESVTLLQPDVVLLEHAGSNWRTFTELLFHLTSGPAKARVLVLWDRYSATDLAAVVRLGASGCLLASSTPATWLRALVSVHAGHCWFDQAELVEALRMQPMPAAAPAAPSIPPDVEGSLTPREREILGFIGGGLTNKEIARRLAISDQTVKTHLHHVYVKLESSGRYKAYLSGSRAR